MNPQKKVDLKLIIIGALGVGKTSLLHRFVHKTFYEDYQTTLGASILSKIIILDDTTLKLQIWDTGGQERFRSMVSTFYKGSDGCILAFDVTDLDTFEALETWRGDVLAKTIPMEQSYPMVVLGNKIDLADRQVPQEVAQDWCKEKDIPYFEVSAKNDINVVQAFEMLASRALSRKCQDFNYNQLSGVSGPYRWGHLEDWMVSWVVQPRACTADLGSAGGRSLR
nr:ras-related protein Rab-7b isoform X1 [Kogia breviceps]XP_058925233.1 ras-related protein Rab-7b isoform X1 [Kogia breviceps]